MAIDTMPHEPQGATSEPKPGYKRVTIPAHTFDLKIEPDPLIDRLWAEIGSKPATLDNYACELYAATAQLLQQVNSDSTDTSSADDASTSNQRDLAAIESAAAKCAAFTHAITELRNAAHHMRDARMVLAPYVTEDKLRRGY